MVVFAGDFFGEAFLQRFLADLAEDHGGVAAGGEGEAQLHKGAEAVFAGFVVEFLHGESQGSAGAVNLHVSDRAEIVGRDLLRVEDGLFDLTGLAFGAGHADAEDGAGGGNLERGRSGCLGGGIGHSEDGAVVMLVGEIAFDDLIKLVEPLGEEAIEEIRLIGADVKLLEP